jgi:hypothetical protein
MLVFWANLIKIANFTPDLGMTVRYSHLAPDFLLDLVERLVPKPADNGAATAGSTATTTATGAILPISAESPLVQ